ncbi:hypothetical protein EDC01DRAFT_325265 [Geopyxis carbonaria]|nr:hypothetical protein EDC01DRAFT_325265 [Geopyxis carbonaria]
MSSKVTAARYGKDNVRLYKVEKNESTGMHTVTETTVCVLLEGEIQTSYTKADNSVVVATDSMKNTVHGNNSFLYSFMSLFLTRFAVLAKQNPVTPPELFGSIVASHFPAKYPHIHTTHVKIITHRWTRMIIDGKPHPHSFYRDGNDVRTVEVSCKRNEGISIKSGLQGLLVLKSTGSAFHGFIRDEFTTLKEANDRILSTEVDASWEWRLFKTLENVKNLVSKFDDAFDKAREITLKTFAQDNSASVQATMYKMAEQIIDAAPLVDHVSYSLPNKHYFEIDLSWHNGLKNTGKDAEVYAPQSNPNGLINCTVSRATLPSKL